MQSFQAKITNWSVVQYVMGAPSTGGFDPSQATDTERAERVNAIWEGYRATSFAMVPQLSVAEVMQRLAARESIVLVDCRSDPERAISIIPASISKAELLEYLEDGPSWAEDKTLIPYCTIGYRSAQFTQELQQRWPQLSVWNMAGSILSWVHAGGIVVKKHCTDAGVDQSTAVTSVHVFGAAWDLAPVCYVTSTF